MAIAPDGAVVEQWLLAYVYDAACDASDVVILDPDDPQRQPVAAIQLPARVPYGFHGNWFPSPDRDQAQE